MRNLMRHQQTHRARARRSLWKTIAQDGVFLSYIPKSRSIAEGLLSAFLSIPACRAIQNTRCGSRFAANNRAFSTSALPLGAL